MKRYRIPYPNEISLLRKNKRKLHSRLNCTRQMNDFADDGCSDIEEQKILRNILSDGQLPSTDRYDSYASTRSSSSSNMAISGDKCSLNVELFESYHGDSQTTSSSSWYNEPEKTEEIRSMNSNNCNQFIGDFSDHYSSDSESETSAKKEMPGSLKEPLLPTSKLRKIDALYMILYYFTRHNLTIEALVDLLKLVNSMLGSKCLPETYYTFSQVFSFGDYAKHHVCSNCFYYFEEMTQVSNSCPCCDGKDREYFISFCLKDQLKSMISRYKDEITQFKNGSSKNDGFLHDIHDGLVLKSNRNEYLLSITFSTDGVATAASNVKSSMWPISLILNDLPVHKRFTRKNTLLSGLWLSKGSPPMAPFLKAFTSQMHNLFTEGIQVGEKTYKFIVASGVADVPGRNKLLNMIQFNGRFGCSYCLHPGTLTLNNQIRYTHKHSELYDSRLHDEQVFFMQEASISDDIVRGMKGYSPLIALDAFDVVKQLPIDYMHNALPGVTKTLLHIWTNSAHHKQQWYLAGQRAKFLLKKRFNNIYSYSEISRSPRDVFNTAKLKANELQNWLLYFSLPCLNGILKEKYFKHFALFRKSISKLLSNNIDLSELNAIDEDLKEFVFQFEKLYGTKYMTVNVHLLTHLVQQVRNVGPLWTVSMFPFEDFNGYLKKMIKGPNKPIIQISRKFALTQKCHFSNRSQISPIAVDYYNTIFKSSTLDIKTTNFSNMSPIQYKGKSLYSLKSYDYIGVKYRPFSKNKNKCDDSLICIINEQVEQFAIIEDIATDNNREKCYFMIKIMEPDEIEYNFYRLEPSTHTFLVEVTNEIKITKCIRFDSGDIFCSKIITMTFKD